MNKKKTKKSDWIIFALFGGFIVAQIISLFVLAGLIVRQTDSLIEQKHKLKAFEQRDNSLVKLQEDYRILEGDIEIIEQALPDKKEIIDFINQVEKEASSSGVSAKIGFSNQAVKNEPDKAKSIVFNVSIKGTYFKTVEFIKQVEKMPQVVNIERIAIQSPDGLERENNVILTMRCYIDPDF